jgi:murein DD-endopeptidase MepM/ murein hydrolase activator NlpD
MIGIRWAAVAALCCIGSAAWADTAGQARFEEERILGRADGQAQLQRDLPFTRRLQATGVVEGPLEDSARAAGLPGVVALEIVRAFAAVIDLDEDLINGDSFSVSYRQEYTIEGHPIGVPQVMWVELRTAVRGTLSAHRFRASHSKQERLWLATGEGAGPTVLRWPVDEVSISSGFGMRSNPTAKPAAIAQSSMLKSAMHKSSMQKSSVRKPSAWKSSARMSSSRRSSAQKKGTGGPVRPGAIRRHVLQMHQGVDFAAETGTPIHAAAAGTVTGARPNGGYGNWIEIRHEGAIATVYGHLLAFAPDIAEGAWVERGQLIGFVGSTGRSTGPHLHFELLQDGVPANPIVHPVVGRARLRAGDLERFRRMVARDLGEG